MMTIVAEKTGYPRRCSAAQMELEADLGIDSIKRVEILSAMRERAPGLPEVKPTELGDAAHARTDRRSHAGRDACMAPRPSGSAAPVAAVACRAAGPAVDLEALMLAIVAEKTGYPAEMLGRRWSSRPTSASTRSSAWRSSPRCGSARRTCREVKPH